MDHGSISTTKNDNNLNKAIVKTVAFFDLFDFPLTAWEVWKFSQFAGAASLKSVYEALDEQKKLEILSLEESYYCLKGREATIAERKKRYSYADRKFTRALAITKLFRLAPWVKLVAVSNQIGSHNLRDEGDIDLFIVAQAGRLWLARLWCAGLAKLLGRRPDPAAGETRDTICLNFFLAEDSLNVEPLLLKDDIYFAYWLASLTPIYDRGGVYQKLIAANDWLRQRLPDWQPQLMNRRRAVAPLRHDRWYRSLDSILGRLEGRAKRIQLQKLPPELKNKMNQGTEVIINDSILKLHSKDRRAGYNAEFLSKISDI